MNLFCRCAARWDCGSIFFFTAQLLNDKKNVLAEFYEEKNLSNSREDWHKVRLAEGLILFIYL